MLQLENIKEQIGLQKGLQKRVRCSEKSLSAKRNLNDGAKVTVKNERGTQMRRRRRRKSAACAIIRCIDREERERRRRASSCRIFIHFVCKMIAHGIGRGRQGKHRAVITLMTPGDDVAVYLFRRPRCLAPKEERCAEVCRFNIRAVFDDRRPCLSHVSIFRIQLRSRLRVTAILLDSFLPFE